MIFRELFQQLMTLTQTIAEDPHFTRRADGVNARGL